MADKVLSPNELRIAFEKFAERLLNDVGEPIYAYAINPSEQHRTTIKRGWVTLEAEITEFIKCNFNSNVQLDSFKAIVKESPERKKNLSPYLKKKEKESAKKEEPPTELDNTSELNEDAFDDDF